MLIPNGHNPADLVILRLMNLPHLGFAVSIYRILALLAHCSLEARCHMPHVALYRWLECCITTTHCATSDSRFEATRGAPAASRRRGDGAATWHGHESCGAGQDIRATLTSRI